jgi:hypothetical protein
MTCLSGRRRSRPLQDDSSAPAKRPRTKSSDQSLFGGIVEDCRIHIFSFLEENDLSSVEQVNHQCRDDSKHSSLSQSRTAIIECHHDSLELLIKKLVQMQTTGKFSSCRFHKIEVKIFNPKHLRNVLMEQIKSLVGSVRLTDVTSLYISTAIKPSLEPDLQLQAKATATVSSTTAFQAKANVLKALCLLLPNLRHVNLSNLSVGRAMLDDLSSRCRHLESITSRCNLVFLRGPKFSLPFLKELLVDDSLFVRYDSWYDEPIAGEPVIFKYCNRSLERVSIKNVLCRHDYKLEGPLSQGTLMRFVRDTPNLKWFRSDLTPDNIAVLQAERPEVTFAS